MSRGAERQGRPAGDGGAAADDRPVESVAGSGRPDSGRDAARSEPPGTSPPADGVDLSIDPPSAFLFTGEICTRSYRLNRFAFDFKHETVRRRFAEAPDELMSDYGLSDEEKALVRARDWTGLVAYGGHHFNIIKIAAAVGESHLHVGAHMRGMDWDELKKTLPHRVELMPGDVE